MINFIKISEYETKPKNRDVFGYICDVASQKINPSTLKSGSLRFDTPIIFHSPLRRAVECLEVKENVRYFSDVSLREIPFDMSRMCSREEWSVERSKIVRRRFKEFFISDRLLISRNEIIRETRNFLARCYILSKTSGITVVSHSFRLKIFEAFIKSQGGLTQTPSLIYDHIKDDKKTFEFGEGFSVAEEDLSFSIL